MFIYVYFDVVPGLDLNIPNALASIGVYMSLVLDIALHEKTTIMDIE